MGSKISHFELVPKPGIGFMDVNYKGYALDGRDWTDLHHDLAGKQTPGIAGASKQYIFSKKFLQHNRGMNSVVWMSPKIQR